jgi:hypothetical protein
VLRTLLDELNTPLSHCGTCAGSIRYVWERCGHPLRAGQSLWHPYEILDPAVQLQMLEAAAIAIDLIESKVLSPRGEQAALFCQSRTPGSPMACQRLCRKPSRSITGSKRSGNRRGHCRARHNPETARSLFARILWTADPESLDRLRVTFAKEGIPQNFCHIICLTDPLHALDRMTG